MKIKKAGLLKTSLAALAIALTGENCTNLSNPVSPQTPSQKIELSKRKLTSSPLFLILSEAEKERVNNFATKPTSLNGYYWVNSKDEVTPDFDLDRDIDFDDFFLFADNFNSTNERYDLVKNGKVDFDDFFFFANEFGKKINSDLSATKLVARKIPQVESFIEPRRIDLSEYVKDLVFNDPITYSIASTNGLIAKVVKNGKGELSVLEYRPRGTFNFTDNGLAELVYKADKKGATAEEKIEVEVERDERGMQLYKETVEYTVKWVNVPNEFYVYTGKRKEKEDPIDPKLWTGSFPTNQEIDWAKKSIEETFGLVYQKDKLKIAIGNDTSKFYNPELGGGYRSEDGKLVIWWDENVPSRGVTISPSTDEEIKSVLMMFGKKAIWPVYLHEASHGMGLNHPKSSAENPNNYFKTEETVFFPDPIRENLSDIDKFVIIAYYDN